MNTLVALLLERSVQFGDFTLASGVKSNIYIDVRKTALTGDGALAIGEHFVDMATRIAPAAAAFGGLTLGADPLVTACAIASSLRGGNAAAVIVRKDVKQHGTQSRLEAPPLAAGAEIVAVDDVVTTAGSTMVAIEALRDAGFRVDHAFCVVDREAGGREALEAIGVSLHAVVTLSELLEHRG